MATVITTGVCGASYLALKPDQLEKSARVAVAQVDCRTVDSAIVAYVGVHGRAPKSIGELTGHVQGDISAYRVVRGTAAGPGC